MEWKQLQHLFSITRNVVFSKTIESTQQNDGKGKSEDKSQIDNK